MKSTKIGAVFGAALFVISLMACTPAAAGGAGGNNNTATGSNAGETTSGPINSTTVSISTSSSNLPTVRVNSNNNSYYIFAETNSSTNSNIQNRVAAVNTSKGGEWSYYENNRIKYYGTYNGDISTFTDILNSTNTEGLSLTLTVTKISNSEGVLMIVSTPTSEASFAFTVTPSQAATIVNYVFEAIIPAVTPSTTSGTTTGGSTTATNSVITFDPNSISLPQASELTETVTNANFSLSNGNWNFLTVNDNPNAQPTSLSMLGTAYSSYSWNTTKTYTSFTVSVNSADISVTSGYQWWTGTITGGDIQTIKTHLLNTYQQIGYLIAIQDNGSYVMYKEYTQTELANMASVVSGTINTVKTTTGTYTINSNTTQSKYKVLNSSTTTSTMYFLKQN